MIREIIFRGIELIYFFENLFDSLNRDRIVNLCLFFIKFLVLKSYIFYKIDKSMFEIGWGLLRLYVNVDIFRR